MAQEPRRHVTDDLAADVLGVLLPVAGQTIGTRLGATLRREWRRNTSVALSAAERESGLPREDLEELIADDEQLMPLYLRVLVAAGLNGHEQTLRAMGAVLGHAAGASREGRQETLGDAARVLRAMEDLDPLHFTVLRAVIDRSREPGVEPGRSGLDAESAAHRTSLPLGSVEQCIVNLAQAGLIRVNNTWMGLYYVPTEIADAVEVAARAID
jgi:hypothetical protein